MNYFPKKAVEKFPAELETHRLRREIVTDALSNRIVNLAGPVFVARMKEMTGASGAEVVRVSVVAEGAFGLSLLKARVDALDGKVDAAVQTSMYADIAELLRRLGLWFLANVPANADFASTIELYRSGVEELKGTFEGLVSAYEKQDTLDRIAELEQAGAPHDLADEIGALPLFGTAPEIAQLADTRGLSVDLVAGAYFAIGAEVGIDGCAASAAASSAPSIGTASRSAASTTTSSPRSVRSPPTRSPARQEERHARRRRRGREGMGEAPRGDAGAREIVPRGPGSRGRTVDRQLTLANSQIRELAAR